jgi:hypothetical protein
MQRIKEGPERLFLGCVRADVTKLLQSRAIWVSCRGLHCCSVDPGLLKVRLPPGSDGMADDPRRSGLCHKRKSERNVYAECPLNAIDRILCDWRANIFRAKLTALPAVYENAYRGGAGFMHI